MPPSKSERRVRVWLGRMGFALAVASTWQTAARAAAAPLRIASFNVQALSARDSDARFAQVAAVVAAARFPDVVALQEIADDDGTRDLGAVGAGATLQRLLRAITFAGGPAYATLQLEPAPGREGGPPGANIRNVCLTTLPPAGPPTLLRQNPSRLFEDDPAFVDTRPPLALELPWGDNHLLVVNVHLSAGPTRAAKRALQSQPLKDFAAAAQSQSSAAVAVVGDFNASDDEAAYQHLAAAGLRDAHSESPRATHASGERFDRIFHAARLVPLGAGRVSAQGASDHDLVWAEFAQAETSASAGAGCRMGALPRRPNGPSWTMLGLVIVALGWRLWKRMGMWEDGRPRAAGARPLRRKARS